MIDNMQHIAEYHPRITNTVQNEISNSTIRVAHVAIWTTDIDRLCGFWARVFGAKVGAAYHSRNRPGFTSRFLSFTDGPTLEVMSGPWVAPSPLGERCGYAHLALSVGSRQKVDAIAQAMEAEQALLSGPRWTGDGFYEAVIRDPEGNLIEITP